MLLESRTSLSERGAGVVGDVSERGGRRRLGIGGMMVEMRSLVWYCT